jgi:hypothetical protein
MISSKKTDRQELITALESIGKTVEEQVDLVRGNKSASVGRNGARLAY